MKCVSKKKSDKKVLLKSVKKGNEMLFTRQKSTFFLLNKSTIEPTSVVAIEK